MKKQKSHIISLAMALTASLALAAVTVDPAKLRPWPNPPASAGIDSVRSHRSAQAVSQARFRNVAAQPTPFKKASSDPELLPDNVIDDGTRINFNVVNWYLGPFIGPGSIRPVHGTAVEPLSSTDMPSLAACVYADGKYYGCDYVAGGGQVMSATYYVIDATTWEMEKTITLNPQWYSTFDQAAYNPADGKVYVLGYDGRRTPYICRLDTETGIYSHLGFCPADIRAMAFDGKGTLFAVTHDGMLNIINPVSGEISPQFRIENEGVTSGYWNTIAFDYHTGELFRIHTDGNFYTHLSLIDIENRTTELVSDLPDFGALGAWVTSPTAPAGAPATVSALNVDFGEAGSHIGTVHVTAPETSFGGESLQGDVTVKVTVDERDAASLTLAPGADGVIEGFDFVKSGSHKVTAVASNAAGVGPSGTIQAYCGPDTPLPAAEVALAVSASGVATLDWQAPAGGVHNGYFNPELLTYSIVRQPGAVEVARDYKGTQFTETLPSALERYYYEVTVACDGIEGAAAESNSVVWGDGLTLPIDTQAGEERFFSLCQIYDNDGDGNTWYETWGGVSCYSGYGSAHNSDDWCMTPPVYLEKGNYYVEIEVLSQDYSVMELTFGNAPVPEAQNHTVCRIEGLGYDDGTVTFREYVSAPSAGKYHFGYHFISENDGSAMPYITVYRLKVTQGPADNAPGAVTDLSGSPFAAGELKTTLRFKAPSKAFDGGTLSDLEKIEICDGDDNLIGTLDGILPGSACEFVDGHASQGVNVYNVYACNASGRGRLARTEVYAGHDVADVVEYMNFSVTANRHVDFEWGLPPVTGINGGYVDPAGLIYNFCRSEYDGVEPIPMDNGQGLYERRFSVDECGPGSTFGTRQHMYFYGVQAITPAGTGRLGYMGLVLGDPCPIPFSESFANGTLNSEVWSSQLVSGTGGWEIVSAADGIEPFDSDCGMLLFTQRGADPLADALVMPLMVLEKMQKPVIMFDMYHDPEVAGDALLSVQVSDNDSQYAAVGQIVASGATERGWSRHKVDLSRFNGSERMFIALVGVASSPSSRFALDNIRVCDDLDTDLAVTSVSAPAKLEFNDVNKFEITVESKGHMAVDSYRVDIFADGVLAASAEGGMLESGGAARVDVYVTPTAAEAGRTVTYEARINLDADENDLNDSASIDVEVGGTKLPAPRNLTGTPADGTMTLSWEAPQPAVPEKVSEGFESYTSFAITDQGEWKFVDGDNLSPYGISGLTYPNMDQPRAFMVWAPGELADFPGKDAWMPRTGNKCLIAFASSMFRMDGEMDFDQLSDEWLISPHVIGGTEVSFYVSPASDGQTERFEFMVSATGRSTDEFTLLGETHTLAETGWKKYTYTLPADAAYFAIHYVSHGYEAFALMIDDIEFTGGYQGLEHIGYNLYTNGRKANDGLLTALTADVTHNPSVDNVYGVSSVYPEGESEMTLLSVPSGIADVSGGSDAVSVTTQGRDIIVTGACGCTLSVTDTQGRTVARRTGTGRDVIKVHAPGVYLVTAGGSSYKIVVN